MSAAVPHRRERLARDSAPRAPRPASSEGRFWKRLQAPFALGAQGFMLGCLLFFTLQPFAAAPAEAPIGGGSMLANLEA